MEGNATGSIASHLIGILYTLYIALLRIPRWSLYCNPILQMVYHRHVIYLPIYLNYRSQQGIKHIMAYRISPLESDEEVESHALECEYAKLKLRQLNDKV